VNREDEISEKMELQEPICYSCVHYLDFRLPKQWEQYGKHRGRCMIRDKVSSGIAKIAKVEELAGEYPSEFSGEFPEPGEKESVLKYLIVNDDSFCNRYEDVHHLREEDYDEIQDDQKTEGGAHSK